MIRRHTLSAMIMHWINALCWILLLGSGFALLANPAMQPIGSWWPNIWAGTVQSAAMLNGHIAIGLFWIGAYIIYCLLFPLRDVLPFLREIFRISPASDISWCMRKFAWLVLGLNGMRSFGITPDLPPQGFYNAGQKFVAIVAVLCGMALALTGILLACSTKTQGLATWVQWALFIHLGCAGLMTILLPVHIYMTSFAPGERPSLLSMLTGFVPKEFAERRSPLWYAALPKTEADDT